jgi:hypothetical protein
MYHKSSGKDTYLTISYPLISFPKSNPADQTFALFTGPKVFDKFSEIWVYIYSTVERMPISSTVIIVLSVFRILFAYDFFRFAVYCSPK